MKRKATYNPEHRTHVVTFRLNDREWDVFQAKLESAGITQSEYLRQIALTAKLNVIIHPVYDSEKLDELLAQCGKIGSNINQIAHWLNGENPMEARLLKSCHHALADLNRIADATEKMAGEL